MASETFCLRWNEFENNLCQGLKELRDDQDFFDVTLVMMSKSKLTKLFSVLVPHSFGIFSAVILINIHCCT